MSDWRDCVVCLIDLIGVKELASKGDGRASALMRQMHWVTVAESNVGLPLHSHIYIWNDSVLLLAYTDGQATNAASILREVDALKKKIDVATAKQSYAIAVKGKAFPDLSSGTLPGIHADAAEHRSTVIKASSYAMANCFLIESKIGAKLKRPWYVDGRLARHVHTKQVFQKKQLALLPTGAARAVYVYDGYLW